MTTAGAEQTATLSFSKQTFAKLSPHPYLLAHLQPSDSNTPPTRANGRSPSQFRPPHINNGSLTHAEGSAVVRTGDTTAVCGVRGEILLASDAPDHRPEDMNDSSEAALKRRRNEAKDLDLLVPNIELATGCSPAFLPGMPPSTLAQALSTRLYSLLHSSRLVDPEDLRIWYRPPRLEDAGAMDEDGNDGEGDVEPPVVKAFWTLYIDILFISLDGNPFDVAWAAVISALRDVRLPYAYWDADREAILCSDELARSKKLTLSGLPMAASFGVFEAKEQVWERIEKGKKHWVLADLDAFEEELCQETVTVVVDCAGAETRLLGIEKTGGVAIGRNEMGAVVELGEKRWDEWRTVMEGGNAS